MKRILVSGPESTGKSELVNYLAGRFSGVAVEEYARAYVESLDRPYAADDVEHIARYQLLSYEKTKPEKGLVFFDTWLIVTRVWFDVVYQKVPEWIDKAIEGATFDMVLLCAPDLPWIADGVRENGGRERVMLYERYKMEFERFGMKWEEIRGSGEERFKMAEDIITRKTVYGSI